MKIKILLVTLVFTLITNNFSNRTLSEDMTFLYKRISPSSLYQEILESGVKFPDVVFAQALLESGNFTSNVFRKENNLFGMKYPRRRKTTSLEEGDTGYANYFHWTHSVYDYKLWQSQSLRNKEIKTQSEYLKHLGRVYAEDKNYVKKLKGFLPRT